MHGSGVVPGPTMCKLKNQESWGYNSVPVWKPENPGSWQYGAGRIGRCRQMALGFHFCKVVNIKPDFRSCWGDSRKCVLGTLCSYWHRSATEWHDHDASYGRRLEPEKTKWDVPTQEVGEEAKRGKLLLPLPLILLRPCRDWMMPNHFRRAHPLLSSLVQMPVSPGNTLTGTHRRKFNLGTPWPVKVTQRIDHHSYFWGNSDMNPIPSAQNPERWRWFASSGKSMSRALFTLTCVILLWRTEASQQGANRVSSLLISALATISVPGPTERQRGTQKVCLY